MVYIGKRSNTLPRAIIQVNVASKGGVWVEVQEILDTGANISVTGKAHLKSSCNAVTDVQSKIFAEFELLLDKTLARSQKLCHLFLRAIHEGYAVVFPNLLTYLIEDSSWKTLIIGLPILHLAGIELETNIKETGVQLPK